MNMSFAIIRKFLIGIDFFKCEVSMDQYLLKIMGFLKHYRVPENEYSFDGKTNTNQIYIQKNHKRWEVHSVQEQNDVIRGVFFCDLDAIDFLYYLVMKEHVKVKKCWW